MCSNLFRPEHVDGSPTTTASGTAAEGEREKAGVLPSRVLLPVKEKARAKQRDDRLVMSRLSKGKIRSGAELGSTGEKGDGCTLLRGRNEESCGEEARVDRGARTAAVRELGLG
jgi:hypothetical protein